MKGTNHRETVEPRLARVGVTRVRRGELRLINLADAEAPGTKRQAASATRSASLSTITRRRGPRT
ncbi:hypothetical protein GCM10025875_04010 [Litorihabitans aurantiacus]|uniref:Uncharacterized protein n=1 Tax=Litorihabitans aurantiacus TaxID=1930061 RepID=A0AA37ULU8_9MICO|nr:hypothetical protein GCM10025875_04010 [Litorihabitans aurantiacus]